ncbi:MAG: toxin-antitoxin system HicB family antitoxin [Desulfobulbaceae bacterium]|nr:toxin-antitoxin system HicB family antitoxin [Desulfobulbaceae bacterium]
MYSYCKQQPVSDRENIMGSISIRGVDEKLAALLKKKASSENKSVNQFVLDTLKKELGLKKEKRFTQEWHDLDSLFGKWSQEEFFQIQEKITSERQIDEEIWR